MKAHSNHDEVWLVVGGDGGLGSAIVEDCRTIGRCVLSTSRRVGRGDVQFDLAADPAGWNLPSNVDVAFMCAGITSIERCENEPEFTRFVNVERSILLAESFSKHAAHVVLLSTNMVFDGSRPFRKVNEPVSPCTEYGRQKAIVEAAILNMGGTVVRLTKVFVRPPRLFQDWLLMLRRGETIKPFHDMSIAPVPVAQVIDTLVAIGEQKSGGIVHISGDMDRTYAEVASELARRIGVEPSLVQPRSALDAGLRPAMAPRYTTLDTGCLGSPIRLDVVQRTSPRLTSLAAPLRHGEGNRINDLLPLSVAERGPGGEVVDELGFRMASTDATISALIDSVIAMPEKDSPLRGDDER